MSRTHSAAGSGDRSGAPRTRWRPAQLRDRVAALLGTAPEAVDDDAHLFRCGLQSLQLMKLVNEMNRAGAAVDFTTMAQDPRLVAWYALLGSEAGVREGVGEGTGAEQADSAAGTEGGAAAAPASFEDDSAPFDESAPFPLTAVQQAYWIGRAPEQPLGGVGCHAYLEIDTRDVEPERLERAVRALRDRHPMLRASFEDDGTQRITDAAWPGLTVHDHTALRADAVPDVLEQLREQLSHRVLDVAAGEVLDVRLSLLPGGAQRLHVNADLLVADVHSIRLLLSELAALYDDPERTDAPRYTFPRYLSDTAARRTAERERARAYWQRRLPDLPGGPPLPSAADPGEIGPPRFVRRGHTLTPDEWRSLRARAAEHGITPAVLLVTAFSEILARWSGRQRFLLNIPLFDRDPSVHPDIERIIADFTSLLLLEVDLAADAGFADRARAVQARLHEDVGHAAYTGVDVLRDFVRADASAPRTAPVVFACNLEAPLVPDDCAARFGELSWMISQTPQVWLDHQVYGTRDGGLLLAWDAVEALFPAGVLDTMFQAYTTLLRSLAADDWSGPPHIPLPHSQLRCRTEANSVTRRESGRLLHQEFFTRAAERADAPALLWGSDGRLGHGELAERALRVAGALVTHGVRPGSPVVVTAPKGPDQIAAVLGVLAAGGTYVPVGVDQPRERRARIHGLSGAVLALDGTGTPPEGHGLPVLPLAEALRADPLDAPRYGSVEDTAYVIFTSGSTGTPKGVEVSHGAAVNTVEDVDERYGIGPEDRVLAVSALDFDLSVWDVFGLLAAGGALVLVDEADRRDARRWLTLCRDHAVTVWNSVPALMDMLLTAADGTPLPVSLRLALLSGDWIGLGLPARLAEASGGRCRLVALGGATEAAIWSNAQEVRSVPAHWRSVPYGRPLANQRFRVVDPQGRDCPDWVPGELWIGGTGVAQGYRGAPDLTAERFPYLADGRWYRTGDLGRYWPDGTLEFLGRMDHQVKVNGFRIELGEIEAALESHPAVTHALATVVGDHTRDLAAAFVPTFTPPSSPAGARPRADGAAGASPSEAAPADGLPPDLVGGLDPHSPAEPSDATATAAVELEAELTETLLAALLAPLLDPTTRPPGETAGNVAPGARPSDGADPHRAPGGQSSAGAASLPVSGPPVPGETGPSSGEAQRGRLGDWAGFLQTRGVLDGGSPGPRWGSVREPERAARLRRRVAGTHLQPVVDSWAGAVPLLSAVLAGTADPEALADDPVLSPDGLAGRLPGVGPCLEAAAHAVEARTATGDATVDLAVWAAHGGRSAAALLERLKPGTVRCTLLDPRASRLAAAEARLAGSGHEIRTAVQDAFAVPEARLAAFDVLVVNDVLGLEPEPDAAARALALLGRPGGRLLLLARTPVSPLALPTATVPKPASPPDAARWLRALRQAGFASAGVAHREPDGVVLITARRPDGAPGVDPASIRARLAERLPAHMVPGILVGLTRLPLSANGKVDRRPVEQVLDQGVAPAESEAEPPRGPSEETVAQLWARVLGVPVTARGADFFALGGDSLAATRLVAALRGRLGVELPMRDVLRAPTVAGMSALVEAARAAGTGQVPDTDGEFEEGEL
ncbi:amino acid adenylation domain-containing protein [Streptomyces sp. NPDC052301]|uniref:amino acid adenylation domain-containing protein n=1 Tax=Streptomyces sp. NPDC052301 TaxID=3365687 RepID=UPI0037D680DD